MRRRAKRKQAASVSLFPFLAVLICTMGALIVLLVMVVQQARVRAETAPISHNPEQSTPHREKNQPSPEEAQRLLIELEDHQWRRNILEQQRKELVNQLSRHRRELSHLEDHIRRIGGRFQQMKQEVDELQRLEQSAGGKTESAGRELARLRQELDRAKRDLEETRARAAKRPGSYAIIPYDGPNGTRRRPIYIECTDRAVIIQPEGIELTAEDFDGPLGPGNPLDAALLAIREYWAAQGLMQNEEPYPLLVVRPNGALRYAMARTAMKSWEDEFGYELVDDQMQLAYPQRDAVLAAVLQRTIKQARRRQALLAAAQPSRFKGGGIGGGLRASRGGGFEAVGGRMGGFNGRRPSGSAAPGQAPGQRGGADRSPNRSTSGQSLPANGRFGGQTSTTDSAGQLQQQQRPNGGNPQVNQSGGFSNGAPEEAGQSGAGVQLRPLSENRGKNWALPNSAEGATGFRRPISVGCFTDQLVIYPDPANRVAAKAVVLSGNTQSSMDEFAAAIRKRVESWGIAGSNAYWKPELRVKVAPGAEARFHELEVLLSGSGMEVEPAP